MTSPYRRIALDLLIAAIIISVGTLGYVVIEGWSAADAAFMTITTVTTVGYGEVHPLTPGGRLFTGALIITGVGYFAYVFATVTRMVVEGRLIELVGRRRLVKKLKAISDHYIICGFGRIGSVIANELAANGTPFVVIDNDPERIAKADELGYVYLTGEATDEDSLEQARIRQARGLISALRSDADNVFIVLTARGLKPELFIISRAEEESARSKLLRAGADKVIMPYHIGARRMAHFLIRPAVADFMELAVHGRSLELQMEEVRIESGSVLVGQTLIDSAVRRRLDLLIVAIKRASGEMVFNPRPHEVMNMGDTLIVLGSPDNLAELDRIAAGKQA